MNGKLSELYSDPFSFVDGLDLSFKNFNLNFFQKYKRLRLSALVIALVSASAWLIFGFDSTIAQPIHFLYSLPSYLSGALSLSGWTNIFNYHYGKDMHWSAFVIYGLMYYFLSRHFEKQGITKSKNVSYSVGLTLMSVAVFEFFWMGSFAFFQNQPWVITFQWPQMRILLQNIAFLFVGIIAVLYMFLDSFKLDKKGKVLGRFYKFNWNLVSFGLVFLSVASAVAWWYYPFPVERFSVKLETGEVWSNSNRFPQTLYTIDMNPGDNLNAGEWFWKENDLVHGLNTLVKVFFTLTFFYVGKVRKVKT